MGASSPVAVGSPSDMKLVNGQEVGDYNALLKSIMGSSGGKANQYSGEAGNMLSKILNNSNNYDNLIKMMTTGETGLSSQLGKISEAAGAYDPQAGLNSFISRSPELQGLAGQMASGAFNESNESARALANRASSQALSSTASQLASSGLLGSGAAMSAMSGAAIDPRMQMEAQLAGQRADLYGNILGNMNSNVLSGLNSGYAQQADLGMQGALGQAQTAQGMYGLMGNIYGQQDQSYANAGQGYAQLAGNELGLYGAALGQMGQMNQPIYWQPQYAAGKSPGTGAMSGMAAGAALGLNPAALAATGGWSALAVPLGGFAGLFT